MLLGGSSTGQQSPLSSAASGAAAGAAFGPYGAAAGAALGFLSSYMGQGQGGGGGGMSGLNFGVQDTNTNTSMAVQSTDTLFVPSVNIDLGGGNINPSNSGGLTSSLPVTQTPNQDTSSTPFPFTGTAPINAGDIPLLTNPAATGIGGTLSGSELILLGGLGLLLILAMGHHKK